MTTSTYRVIYGDTDQMGVVYYANYLAFFERGRCEWLRDHAIDYAQVERDGFIVPVVEAHVKYTQPAKFDDLISIDADITAATRATFTFTYAIKRGETLLCTARPRTAPDADLWITAEGWDGSVHQAPWPIATASPATVEWLKKQGASR